MQSRRIRRYRPGARVGGRRQNRASGPAIVGRVLAREGPGKCWNGRPTVIPTPGQRHGTLSVQRKWPMRKRVQLWERADTAIGDSASALCGRLFAGSSVVFGVADSKVQGGPACISAALYHIPLVQLGGLGTTTMPSIAHGSSSGSFESQYLSAYRRLAYCPKL